MLNLIKYRRTFKIMNCIYIKCKLLLQKNTNNFCFCLQIAYFEVLFIEFTFIERKFIECKASFIIFFRKGFTKKYGFL